jgi:hypothetical protein
MIRNKIQTIAFLLSCFPAAFGLAQSPDEIESKMNEIKLDENYIFGEDFNDDKNIAFQNALTELTTYANELRAEREKDILNSSDLLTVVKELRYQRGGRHTVLVYLPLGQILGMTSKSHSDIVAQATPTQPIDSLQQKIGQGQNYTIIPAIQSGGVQSVPIQNQLPNDIMQTLCGQDNWVEIKILLTTYKHDGRISSVGNVLSYEEVPDDAYAILMDDMGGILTILSPKNSKKQINYRTNQADSETNYSNCKFIVWYK